MDATLILIDSDAELVRARALVDRLWNSEDPGDIARLQAQARLIAAYEESKWPHRPPSTAELIPGALVEIIPDCGHFMMVERPDETLDALKSCV